MEYLSLSENSFCSSLKNFYANEFKKLVKVTNPVQIAVPFQTVPFEFSHSPGVARITGTPTTRTNEIRINKLVDICIAVIMFKGLNVQTFILRIVIRNYNIKYIQKFYIHFCLINSIFYLLCNPM